MPKKGTTILCGERYNPLVKKVFNRFKKTSEHCNDFKEYRRICEHANNLIRETALKDPSGFRVPYLGYLCVHKYKSSKVIADPLASRTYQKKIPFSNIHSCGYIYGIKIFKVTSAMKLGCAIFYKFKADRKFKRDLAAKIKSGNAEQFQVMATNHFQSKIKINDYILNNL